MVVCMDTSGLIYTILSVMSVNVTGSFYLSTLVVALFLMAITAMFGVPIEYMAILLLPLHLGLLACLGTDWLAVTGLILIYLGIIVGKNLFFRS